MSTPLSEVPSRSQTAWSVLPPFLFPIAMLTFLSLAAPVPERMASIKACLASTVLLRVAVLNLETVMGVDGDWEAGGSGGGRAGGGGRPGSSC